jgi:hypothetical protein
LNKICSHEAFSTFKHYHEMSIIKFRNIQKSKKDISAHVKGEDNNLKTHKHKDICKDQTCDVRKVKLYTIFEITRKMFGSNPEIDSYFEKIKQKRIERIEKEVE